MKSASTEPFRELAISLKESGFAAHAARLEDALGGTWTTSTELLGELGRVVLSIRRECRPLSPGQKRLVNDCLCQVRVAWPGYGLLEGRGLMSGLCAFTGLASFVVLILLVVVAGALTPGYSHVSQFISELGARDAPHEWGVRLAGFLPAGVLLLAFCGFALAALPRSTAATLGFVGLAFYAAGYLVAVAFPCDPGCRPENPSLSQLIHNGGGMLGYLLAPVFLLLLARAAGSWPGGNKLAMAGYAAAGLALLGLISLSPASPVAGLSQRLLELAVLGWVALCSMYVARQGAGAPEEPGPAAGG